MQIWLLQKVFPFSSKLARRSEQLSWLVKRNTFFQKIKFSNVFISLISVQNIPLSMQISTFSKMCREVLFINASYFTRIAHERTKSLISNVFLVTNCFKRTFLSKGFIALPFIYKASTYTTSSLRPSIVLALTSFNHHDRYIPNATVSMRFKHLMRKHAEIEGHFRPLALSNITLSWS